MRTLIEVIHELGERALVVRGDPSRQVVGFAAATPGCARSISFITGRDQGVPDVILGSESDAFLVPQGSSDGGNFGDKVLIEVHRPRLEFARIASRLFPPPQPRDTHGVDVAAEIGQGTRIGPGCVVEAGVRIGADSTIGPNVVLRTGTVVGHRVQIGPGCVIGEQGFGFERDERGRPLRLPHYGGVVIGNDVEVGPNVVIDKGVFVDTTVGDGAKIDSQVLVGHNVNIQEDALVIGGVVLCGGVEVGARSRLAPNSTIMEKISVGDDATVGIGAVVCRDVSEGDSVMGVPARPALRLG